jgi:hypothetical protein
MTFQQCKEIKPGTIIKSNNGSIAIVEKSSNSFPNSFCGWCIKEYGNELYIRYEKWNLCTKEEIDNIYKNALNAIK